MKKMNDEELHVLGTSVEELAKAQYKLIKKHTLEVLEQLKTSIENDEFIKIKTESFTDANGSRHVDFGYSEKVGSTDIFDTVNRMEVLYQTAGDTISKSEGNSKI